MPSLDADSRRNDKESSESTDDGNWFFNRMFIRPKYRNSRLMVIGTAAMLCYLTTRHANQGIKGVISENENPKLHRPGVRRLFERSGYRYLGSARGRKVWYFPFDDVRFVDDTA